MTTSYLIPGKGFFNGTASNNSYFVPYYGFVTDDSGTLVSGIAITVSSGNTIATVSIGVPIGGVAPYTYQWYRSTTSGFTPGAGNIVAGATSRTLSQTGLTNGTLYYYKCITTDSASTAVTSNETVAGPQGPIVGAFIGGFFG